MSINLLSSKPGSEVAADAAVARADQPEVASVVSQPRVVGKPLWRRVARWFLRATERFLAVVGLLMLIYYGCFRVSEMTSPSMSPTLRGDAWYESDRILTEKVTYWFRQPRRWEVISFWQHGHEVMKRVVGLPGETVQMHWGGKLYIDGKEMPWPEELKSIEYFPFGNIVNKQVYECGDGYYVLGDDSRDSDDSRFNGAVPPEMIIGRTWMIISPKERRGFVNIN